MLSCLNFATNMCWFGIKWMCKDLKNPLNISYGLYVNFYWMWHNKISIYCDLKITEPVEFACWRTKTVSNAFLGRMPMTRWLKRLVWGTADSAFNWLRVWQSELLTKSDVLGRNPSLSLLKIPDLICNSKTITLCKWSHSRNFGSDKSANEDTKHPMLSTALGTYLEFNKYFSHKGIKEMTLVTQKI